MAFHTVQLAICVCMRPGRTASARFEGERDIAHSVTSTITRA